MSTGVLLLIAGVLAILIALVGTRSSKLPEGVIYVGHLGMYVDLSTIYSLYLYHENFSMELKEKLYKVWDDDSFKFTLVFLCGKTPETIGTPNEQGYVLTLCFTALSALTGKDSYAGDDAKMLVPQGALTETDIIKSYGVKRKWVIGPKQVTVTLRDPEQ